MKKKLLNALLVVAMVATTLVGCGGSDTTSTEKKEETKAETKVEVEAEVEETAEEVVEEVTEVEPVELNIAYMPNYGSLWAITNAVQAGFMEYEGITVNLHEYPDGPSIIDAMEAGDIDLGYIGQGAHKHAINGRVNIFALSHISNGDAIVARDGLATIEELAGMKVAYVAESSSENILVNALTRAGMTMDDIDAVPMEASDITDAMINGDVNAAAIWSPHSLDILDGVEGGVKLADNMTFADETVSLSSWIVTPSYVEANRDVVVRFTRALFKAMDAAAYDNYDITAGYVADIIGADAEAIYQQRGDAQWMTGKEVATAAGDGTVAGYYTLQKQAFLTAGAIEVDPAVEEYVMLDVMIEAGQY